jgi:hypothetical protein
VWWASVSGVQTHTILEGLVQSRTIIMAVSYTVSLALLHLTDKPTLSDFGGRAVGTSFVKLL